MDVERRRNYIKDNGYKASKYTLTPDIGIIRKHMYSTFYRLICMDSDKKEYLMFHCDTIHRTVS